MKLTYTSERSQEELSKMMTQHANKATTLNNCVENAIADNARRVEERIKLRKQRSATAREKSEKTEDPVVGEHEKKMYVVDIEVIKEEKEEYTDSPSTNQTVQTSKRRYSFETPFSSEDLRETEQHPR